MNMVVQWFASSQITQQLSYSLTCSSSLAAGGTSSTNTSTMSHTAVSDWPTPTVSTKITSYPAPDIKIRKKKLINMFETISYLHKVKLLPEYS